MLKTTIATALLMSVTFSGAAHAEKVRLEKPTAEEGQRGPMKPPGELFASIDVDGSGAVSIDEFLSSHEGREGRGGREPLGEDKLRDRFAKMDADDSGDVTLEEFRKVGPKGQRGNRAQRGHQDGADQAQVSEEDPL